MTQSDLTSERAGGFGRDVLTGTRIRERRTVLGLRQAELARRVEISASYLNLIEHNRRRIGGKLLKDIATVLSVDVAALTHGAEVQLLDELAQAAVSSPGVPAELDRMDEFVGRFPGWARLIAAQGSQITGLQTYLDGMLDRLSHDPVLSDVLHDLLSKVTSISATAAILAETKDLEPDWQEKFILNMSEDSRDLAARSATLVKYLDGSLETTLTLNTPLEELDACLSQSGYHLPTLETGADRPETLVVKAAGTLKSDEAKGLAETFYERYRRDAARMPLAEVQEFAGIHGHDPVALASAFQTDLASAMRRLAMLPEEDGLGATGLLVCDASGVFTFRKQATGFSIPRYGASCGVWPLFRALTQPGVPIRNWIVQPGAPAGPVLAYAICSPVPPMVFDGRQAFEATMLMVPQARLRPGDATSPRALEVGTTCRTCPVADCPARRESSILPQSF